MNHNPPPRRPQTPQRRPDGPTRRPTTSAAPRSQGNPARPLIHPARAARRRRQRSVIMSIFVVIILLICLLIGLIFSELATAIGTLVDRTASDKPDKGKTTTVATDVTGDSSTSTGTSAPSAMAMTTVQMAKEEISTGMLQLVGPEHPYVFPASISNIVNLFDNRPYVTLEDGTKTRAYKVRNSNQSLDRTALDALNHMLEAFYNEYKVTDLLVTWAYRSLKDQEDLYALYVKDYPGYSDAQIKQLLLDQVDTPGYSEHHLGTCVDLKLYTDSGVTYALDENPGYLSWLTENCWKYGFILRYPTEKAAVTGISYDPHHFRFVEVPHAYYMMSNGLCLEEYLEELRETTAADGDHLKIEVDGGDSYEVYYVKANGGTVDIPVPTDYPYTVSGDNQSGFIVTVTMD